MLARAKLAKRFSRSLNFLSANFIAELHFGVPLVNIFKRV